MYAGVSIVMSLIGPDELPVPGLPGNLREWIRVLEVNPDGILVVDAAGVFTWANDAAIRILNLQRDEILGRHSAAPGWPLRGVSGQPFGPELPFMRVLSSGVSEFDVELVLDSVDGTRTVLSMNLGSIGDDPVAVRGAIASFRDITQRKRAEEHQRLLAEAGRMLAGSLDYHRTLHSVANLAVPDFADWCVVDMVEPEGIRRVATAHRDPGKAGELAELAERFPPHLSTDQPVSEVLRTGEVVYIPLLSDAEVDRRAVSADHARLIRSLGGQSVIAAPLIARAEPMGAITFVRTARRFEPDDLPFASELAGHAGLAIDNARLFEQAQESNRAKTTFISVMSHEFRTPLTTIVGYTELLATEVAGPLTEKQHEQLARIRASAWHLTQVIDEILTFSRGEAGRERVHRERVDLRELAAPVASLFDPAASAKDLALRVEVGTEPIVIHTDGQKVRQILFNLVSNAVKFTEKGEVRVCLAEDGVYAVIEVVDTGIGIAPEHREKVFESFWQVGMGATRTAPGTGLGLTITRRLAHLLGGRVELDSEIGKGSVFRVFLPVGEE